MKFTKEKLERAFCELLEQQGFRKKLYQKKQLKKSCFFEYILPITYNSRIFTFWNQTSSP